MMPYRESAYRFEMHNQGLQFLDSQLYEAFSTVAWPIDALAEGMAKIMFFFNPRPAFVSNLISGGNGSSYGWILGHKLGMYFCQETKKSLQETDDVYGRHHQFLLESLLRRGSIKEMNLVELTEEHVWGPDNRKQEVGLLASSDDAERYWQALLIDYALTQDSVDLKTEVVDAVLMMKKKCLGYVVSRLFDNHSYSPLQVIQNKTQYRKEFDLRKTEHFDALMEGLPDTEALDRGDLFVDFNYAAGLQRILRISIMRGEYGVARRVAESIHPDTDDDLSFLQTLFDTYVELQQHGKASEIYTEMSRQRAVSDDGFVEELGRSEQKAAQSCKQALTELLASRAMTVFNGIPGE